MIRSPNVVGFLVVGDMEGRLMVCLVMLSKRISRPPLRYWISCQGIEDGVAKHTYENSTVRIMSCAILVQSGTHCLENGNIYPE